MSTPTQVTQHSSDVLVQVRDIQMTVPGPSGPRTILNNVSLEAKPGQFIAITGRTGCGKSTLLKILAGVLTPQQGAVIWKGETLDFSRPARLTRLRAGFLGYLEQDSPVIEGLTCLDNIILGAGRIPRKNRASVRDHAQHVADELGLSEVLDHEVSTLSGGERQRTGIARLLMAEPAVLILDEPTSALDENTARTLITVLHDRAAVGTAIITATHDPLLMQAASIALPMDNRNPTRHL